MALNLREGLPEVEDHAEATARNHAYRTDTFLRWVWDREGGYSLAVDHDYGDHYLTEFASIR